MCVPSLREGGMCRIVIKNVVWRVVSLSVICVGLAFVDIGSEEAGLSQNPHDLLVFSLTWLYRQTLLIHLMHIPCCLHVAQYVILQLWYRLQGVRHILVLLDITYNFCRLGTFGEVN